MQRRSSAPGPLFASWTIALILALPLPTRMTMAQGAPGMQPLAIPDGVVMRCRAAATSRSDSLPAGATAWEFEMGRPGFASRDVTVTIDSTGRPLELTEITFEDPGGGLLLHGVSARFSPVAGVIGVHVRRGQRTAAAARESGGQAALFAKSTRPLTPVEQRQVATLATWLSGHRCGRHPKGVAASPLATRDGHR